MATLSRKKLNQHQQSGRRRVANAKIDLNALAAAMPAALLVIDRSEEVVYANPAAEQLFGKHLPGRESCRCGDFIACENRHQDPEGCGYSVDCPDCPLLQAIRLVLSEGDDGGGISGTTQVIRDGTAKGFWVTYQVRKIVIAADIFVAMVLEDVTRQRQTRDRQKKTDAKYRKLLETMTYGVEEVDLDGRLIYTNDAYNRMHGYEPGELAGKYIWDFDPRPEDVQRLKAYFAFIKREQPPPVPYIAQNVQKDGTIIDVKVEWNYLRGADGSLEGFISVVTEETASNEMAASLERSRRDLELREKIAGLFLTAPRDRLFSDILAVFLFAGPLLKDGGDQNRF